VVALRNFSRKNADCSRVSASEGFK
jgi:hypothetical protein